MKVLGRSVILLIMSFFFISWGFYAHKKINRMAAFTLPANLGSFYKRHIHYITEHAVDADKRRYISANEAPKHYIDVDAYDIPTIDSIPASWIAAVNKYTADTLLQRGIVPWQILHTYKQLTKAFINKEIPAILKHSADLGHYIADANVPLHTTKNYNGQLTDQVGIHAFWESRLPELYTGNYNFLVGAAHYIDSPLDTAWKMVKHSFNLVDSVLLIEADLNTEFPEDKKYSYEQRARTIEKVYAETYSARYHQRLNGMVEQQMRNSIIKIGCFWYSAWVDAGQPDLTNISSGKRKQTLPTHKQDSVPQNEKLIGREEWH
ncbi:S1/P1 Nuclease [Olivibacter sp. SDN3]|uniref:zinc dependent phospholipase C family protein n=1 Tax=Olivibacter sp. SDN3 TaxID=2764720 RepID=UPI0016513092|nr:zinc dependent phospholipase C family protein [Olivibacter sp. SDN3]QNL49480.1 S1/P1 Nuclease [Olivibacter sp. SDN3]